MEGGVIFRKLATLAGAAGVLLADNFRIGFFPLACLRLLLENYS